MENGATVQDLVNAYHNLSDDEKLNFLSSLPLRGQSSENSDLADKIVEATDEYFGNKISKASEKELDTSVRRALAFLGATAIQENTDGDSLNWYLFLPNDVFKVFYALDFAIFLNNLAMILNGGKKARNRRQYRWFRKFAKKFINKTIMKNIEKLMILP